MANGYSGILSLDPALMEQRSIECAQQAEAVQRVISDVDKILNALVEEWKGQASVDYKDQWETLKKDVLQVENNLSVCSQQLKKIAENTRNLDIENAGQLGVR